MSKETEDHDLVLAKALLGIVGVKDKEADAMKEAAVANKVQSGANDKQSAANEKQSNANEKLVDGMNKRMDETGETEKAIRDMMERRKKEKEASTQPVAPPNPAQNFGSKMPAIQNGDKCWIFHVETGVPPTEVAFAGMENGGKYLIRPLDRNDNFSVDQIYRTQMEAQTAFDSEAAAAAPSPPAFAHPPPAAVGGFSGGHGASQSAGSGSGEGQQIRFKKGAYGWTWNTNLGVHGVKIVKFREDDGSYDVDRDNVTVKNVISERLFATREKAQESYQAHLDEQEAARAGEQEAARAVAAQQEAARAAEQEAARAAAQQEAARAAVAQQEAVRAAAAQQEAARAAAAAAAAAPPAYMAPPPPPGGFAVNLEPSRPRRRLLSPMERQEQRANTFRNRGTPQPRSRVQSREERQEQRFRDRGTPNSTGSHYHP